MIHLSPPKLGADLSIMGWSNLSVKIWRNGLHGMDDEIY